MKFIKKTKSLCNTCLKKIPAEIYEYNNKIYIKKICKKHGTSVYKHRFDDAETYHFLTSLELKGGYPSGVFLEITKKCNLNCNFCYINAGVKNKERDLDLDKIPSLDKYKNIFITGGEPTCRKDLFEIVKCFKEKKKRVFLLSNGIKLANLEYAKKLKKSGITCVLLQFDTFDDETYKYIRGKPLTLIKNKAISNLEKENIPVFLLDCVVDNINIKDFKLFPDTLNNNRNIKMLVFIPVSGNGRYKRKFPETSKLLESLCKAYNISKKDFFQSTELMANILNLFPKIIKNRRFSNKCDLTCLVLINKNVVIPISKIFDVEKINRKIKKMNSKWDFLKFFIFFLISQNIINFLKNKNYRLFLTSSMEKLKFLFAGNKLLLSPLVNISFSRFQSLENYDIQYTPFCSRTYYNQKTNNFEPPCKYIIKTNKK